MERATAVRYRHIAFLWKARHGTIFNLWNEAMQHPSLIERSVGATLRAFSSGRVTREEAELDLVELIASQIVGKTDYAVAVIAYYVRAVLIALSKRKIDLADAFDTFVDAATGAADGKEAVSTRLAQPFVRRKSLGGFNSRFPA